MASSVPEEVGELPGGALEAPDPHASKVPPDHPDLRLNRPRGRTLKKGPALAVALSLVGAILLSLVFALEPAKPADKGAQVEPQAAPPVVVPEVIRTAPDRPPPGEGHPFDEAPNRPGRQQAGSRMRGATDPHAQNRRELDYKAETAGVLFDMNTGAGSSGAPASRSLDDRARPTPVASEAGSRAAAQLPVAGPADEPNMQGRKNAFIDADGAAKVTDESPHRVQRPRSAFQVQAGAIIPAVLLTGINSDLPGPVIGQVRENVYDSVTGNYLLIPQGSRLIASYDSMVAWGQERVLMCWNRIVFPNGNSLNLACMPAADLSGAAGLTDEVDEHWWRILKGAAIASLLAATSQGIAGNTQGFNPTVPQLWARNTADEVNNVGQQITRRNLNIQPTITVRPGFSVNVIVTKDLTIPPYEVTR